MNKAQLEGIIEAYKIMLKTQEQLSLEALKNNNDYQRGFCTATAIQLKNDINLFKGMLKDYEK